MRWILYFLWVWPSLSLMGQIPSLNKEVSWKQIECALTDEEKLSILADQTGDLFYYLKDNGLLEESLSNFHFLDLNNDEHLDFIYEGYAGTENKMTLFFVQHEKGYFDKISELEGTVYDIMKHTLYKPSITFKLLSFDPCFDCLGVFNLTTYVYLNEQFFTIETLSYTKETELPNQIEFDKKFKVTNTKYYLRSTPEVINKDGTQNTILGNVIAEFSNGAIGKALASKTDSTGRVWWFVLMKAEDSDNAIFKMKQGFYLGWMSSRYVEKL